MLAVQILSESGSLSAAGACFLNPRRTLCSARQLALAHPAPQEYNNNGSDLPEPLRIISPLNTESRKAYEKRN